MKRNQPENYSENPIDSSIIPIKTEINRAASEDEKLELRSLEGSPKIAGKRKKQRREPYSPEPFCEIRSIIWNQFDNKNIGKGKESMQKEENNKFDSDENFDENEDEDMISSNSKIL